MKRLYITFVAVYLVPGVAWAEWTVTNRDAYSYSLVRQCGSRVEDWSIAGGTTKKLSIPAGATSCTVKLKDSTCTVRDGQSCVIQSGKIRNG